MKLKGNVISRKDFKLGRRALRWAATGMNYRKDEDLDAFCLKAKHFLGNPADICRIGLSLRPMWTKNGYITQSAVAAAVEGWPSK